MIAEDKEYATRELWSRTDESDEEVEAKREKEKKLFEFYPKYACQLC